PVGTASAIAEFREEAVTLVHEWLPPGAVTTSLHGMGKASDWLREERRKVLGDWVAFCTRCGAAQRWFEEFEDAVARECPQCGGEMLRRCPSCDAAFSSVFAVTCESCGAQLRPNELFGGPIRSS
ncbi:MAG TPA: hypothetical protein VF877_04710, partial [Gaiellaceae bacterium]